MQFYQRSTYHECNAYMRCTMNDSHKYGNLLDCPTVICLPCHLPVLERHATSQPCHLGLSSITKFFHTIASIFHSTLLLSLSLVFYLVTRKAKALLVLLPCWALGAVDLPSVGPPTRLIALVLYLRETFAIVLFHPSHRGILTTPAGVSTYFLVPLPGSLLLQKEVPSYRHTTYLLSIFPSYFCLAKNILKNTKNIICYSCALSCYHGQFFTSHFHAWNTTPPSNPYYLSQL